MELIRRETRWVVGVPVEEGGSGDPSPATARGLMAAMRATMRHFFGEDGVAGRHVAVLGVGKVGSDLVRRLVEAGARVTIADIYAPAVARLRDTYSSNVVDAVEVDEIFDVACDIFSPCSLGGTLNEKTIPRLRCQIVLGSANNQLAVPEDADRLAERGIVYAPDFVVNAGGLINVAEELRGYTVEKAAARVDKIYDSTLRVLEAAHERRITPQAAALEVAQERIRSIGDLRLFRRSGDDRN
jgi:glutamate dehydrogenase/leucine dehydrogenase